MRKMATYAAHQAEVRSASGHEVVQRSIAALDFSVALMILHKEGPSMNGKENLVLLLTRGRQRVRRGGAGCVIDYHLATR